MEEIFDICDADDRVIGQAPRSEVHARKLLHRAVHIWVFQPDGQLLLHLRSATKDEYPHCYTSSASGHLGTGEDYATAAQRELEEELGLTAPLTYVGKLPAGPETAYEHTVLYRCEQNTTPRPDPGEIASIEYLTVPEWLERIADQPELFTPPVKSLLAAFGKQVQTR